MFSLPRLQNIMGTFIGFFYIRLSNNNHTVYVYPYSVTHRQYNVKRVRHTYTARKCNVVTVLQCDTSGVSRNLMMCMHILEAMNSIVYLAQSVCGGWFEVGGLVRGQYCNGKITIFYKLYMLILSNWITFFVFQKNSYKIMAFSSDKIKQALMHKV